VSQALQPLDRVQADLESILRSKAGDLLADRLAGRGLPAFGGDEEPAEILFRALVRPPARSGSPQALADLLADLVETAANAQDDAMQSHQRNEPYFYNMFLLASLLPPVEKLFDGLQRLWQLRSKPDLVWTGADRESRQLRQALIYQQTNDSLEETWLSLLRTQPPSLDAEAMDASLLEAWTGLLWCPPSLEQRQAGDSLDVPRALVGLRGLHEAVERRPNARPYLRSAVRELHDSFPRSPEFWAAQLGPSLAGLPDLVQEVLREQWPNLHPRVEPQAPAVVGSADQKWDPAFVRELERRFPNVLPLLEKRFAATCATERLTPEETEGLRSAVTRELMARDYEKLRIFPDKSSMAGYLGGWIAHAYVDYRGRRGDRIRGLEQGQSEDRPPAQRSMDRQGGWLADEVVRVFAEILRDLPVTDRVMVLMRLDEGVRATRVARAHGVKLRLLQRRCKDVIHQVCHRLEQSGDDAR
jgi:DNA-directed RNA polymerase specialized sigma24 family protein